MLYIFTRHYLTDWAGMFFSLLWLYFIGEKKRSGFLVGIAANLSWLGFGIVTHSIASIVTNIAFVGLNFRAWLKWRPAPQNSDTIS